MNIKFDPNNLVADKLQNILKGKYYDITPKWFEGVGTVIILTMIMNVFSTPIIVLGFHLIRLIKRGIDQGLIKNIK